MGKGGDKAAGAIAGRFGGMSSTARAALAAGETDQVEYKAKASAVTPADLAAAANWTALNRGKGPVQLLIGVKETHDKRGATIGEVIGFPTATRLQTEIETLQQKVSTTYPAPVAVNIFEEATESATPFLRAEISATFPPHHDFNGHRQTRQGPTTRAMSDDEVLSLYMIRESAMFEHRFRAAADVVTARLDDVMSGLDTTLAEFEERVATRFAVVEAQAEGLSQLAADAVAAAEEASERADGISQDLFGTNIEAMLEHLMDAHPGWSLQMVGRARQLAWRIFLKDVEGRTSRQAMKLRDDFRDVLQQPSDTRDRVAIFSELVYWREHSPGHAEAKPMTWWRERVSDLRRLAEPDSYSAIDLGPEAQEDLSKYTRQMAGIAFDMIMAPRWPSPYVVK